MVAPADSWIPGYRFKDGKLFIFEAAHVTLIQVAPEASAAEKWGDGPWRPVVPSFPLVRPYRRRKKAKTAARQLSLPLDLPPTDDELREQKRRAFDSLRFALPKDLARAIEPFQIEHFALIRMFRATNRFLDLLQSNPPLAFYLASWFAYGPVRSESAEALVSKKQTALLEHLRLPGTPAAMKTLRKVPPESVYRRILPSLRKALGDDEVRKDLAHVRCVNTGVLKLVGNEQLRRSAAPALLEEVGNDKRERYLGETATLLEGVLWFHKELHGPSANPPVFSTMLRVRETHHALSERYAGSNASGILKCVFPQTPVQGTRDIVPLTKPLDLVQEGIRQRNCVASYAPEVERGDLYIYRVLGPERATLAIRRSSAGLWYCSELRAACNEPVTRATERAVDRWLEDRTVSA